MKERGNRIRPPRALATLIARGIDAALVLATGAFVGAFIGMRGEGAGELVEPLYAVPLFLLAGEACGLYRSWRPAPLVQPLLESCGLTAAAIAALSLALGSLPPAALLWLVLAPAAMLLWRGLGDWMLLSLRRRGWLTRKVAILGATERGMALARELREEASLGMTLLGFYDDRAPERVSAPLEVPLLGMHADLIARARAGRVDIVYIALPLEAQARIRDLVQGLSDSCVSVYVVADLLPIELTNGEWNTVGDVPVVSIVETPFWGVGGALKRVEDLVLGAAILTVVAVPMMIIALAIKLTMGGPVIFRQRRYGLNGEEIVVLKFRTMCCCEDGGDIAQARAADPRITRLGAILRRSSLDELPQLFNVLAGEMSVVGPRPHAVAHNELYRRLIPGYMIRHKVKPGITGWAQVNGWRGETDTVDKMVCRVEHDLQYIRDWSLGLDIKIVFLTVFSPATWLNAR